MTPTQPSKEMMERAEKFRAFHHRTCNVVIGTFDGKCDCKIVERVAIALTQAKAEGAEEIYQATKVQVKKELSNYENKKGTIYEQIYKARLTAAESVADAASISLENFKNSKI